MKGIYVLAVQVSRNMTLDVGALGQVRFKKGLYAYVGSAQCSLEKRVERHLRRHKRKFWHIDHLLDADGAKVIRVFHRNLGKPEECRIARQLTSKGIPITSFGASDCRCRSHLFRLADCEFLGKHMSELVL